MTVFIGDIYRKYSERRERGMWDFELETEKETWIGGGHFGVLVGFGVFWDK
jgi:hypothetical protein